MSSKHDETLSHLLPLLPENHMGCLYDTDIMALESEISLLKIIAAFIAALIFLFITGIEKVCSIDDYDLRGLHWNWYWNKFVRRFGFFLLPWALFHEEVLHGLNFLTPLNRKYLERDDEGTLLPASIAKALSWWWVIGLPIPVSISPGPQRTSASKSSLATAVRTTLLTYRFEHLSIIFSSWWVKRYW